MANSFPEPDLENVGWVKGWGVYRNSPWHFVGLYQTEAEAKQVKIDKGGDYQAVFGSHRLGSDDFVHSTSGLQN